MTEAVAEGGQVQSDSQGTTEATPEVANGSGGQAQTTQTGSVAAEESFFDPRSIQGKPELEQAYKQMQGEFTKRMQGIRSSQQKLDMYSRFERDPIGTIQALAPQYGLQILQGENKPNEQDFKSWDDAKDYFFKEFEKKSLNPLANEVKNLKQQNVEQFLDTNHSDWRTYESAMMDILREHPTLANSPSTLYKMAVPQNVLEARATQAAMQKLKSIGDNSQISGGTTVKQTSSEPTGKLSFNQAVEVAKKRVGARGLRP